MIYLRKFDLASLEAEGNIIKHWKNKLTIGTGLYPFNIFPLKEIYSFSFENPITILYGDNGSGKSTLLNIIAEKLKLKRSAAYNRTHWFNEYISYGLNFNYIIQNLEIDKVCMDKENQNYYLRIKNIFKSFDNMLQKEGSDISLITDNLDSKNKTIFFDLIK